MTYSPEYYQKHKEKRLEHNRKYLKENREEVNQRRRERYAENPRRILDRNNQGRNLKKACSNLESIDYSISSVASKGRFLLINLVSTGLRGSEEIEGDFRQHFERALSAHDKLHLSRRYFIESTKNTVYIYIDSAIQNYSKDELINFLGVYKQVLERGVTHSAK